MVGVGAWTVSADGNTLNQSFTSNDSADGQTVSSTASETRLAPAPAGAHALSGSWQPAPPRQLSDNALSVIMRTTGEALAVSFPTGKQFTAMLGGSFVPVARDPSGQMVAARMVDPRTLELSYQHKGKVDEVDTIAAASAGDTVAMTSLDKRTGNTNSVTLRKQ